MADRIGQDREKQLLREAQIAERRKAASEPPASRDDLRELVRSVGEGLGGACDHTLRHTLAFIRLRGLDEQRVIAWLRRFGGYCDCEVVMNVEDAYAAAAARSALDKLLHQERKPVCTVISLLATLVVEAVILLVVRFPGSGIGAVGVFLWVVLLVMAALISNIVGGWVAYKRGEFWGGRIAMLGIALWLVTVMILQRGV